MIHPDLEHLLLWPDGWVSSSVSPKRKKGKSKKGKDQKKHKEPVGFYQRKTLVPCGKKEKVQV